MSLFNPAMWFELSDRSIRSKRHETDGPKRVLAFNAVPSSQYKLRVNDQEVPRGCVEIRTGRFERNGEEVLGQIQYIETYSLDRGPYSSLSLSELLEMKEEHIQKNGKEDPFPLEHLIQPATFYVIVWVDEQTFNDLKEVNLSLSHLSFLFGFKPKEETTLESSDGLWDEIVLSWDVKKEPYICAEEYNFGINPRKEPSPPESPTDTPEPEPEPEAMATVVPLIVEALGRMTKMERILRWGLAFLIGTFLLVLLQKC